MEGTYLQGGKRLPIFAGTSFNFGQYPYEATGEIKPIQWTVWALSPRQKIAILISKNIIDAKPFHSEFKGVSWNESYLFHWLNDEFLNNAFSAAEQTVIVRTTQRNVQVAIPTMLDLRNMFSTDKEQTCHPTPYATKRGVWTDQDTGCGPWWVNQTGNGYAVAVNPQGACDETKGIAVDYDDIGVRPMIVLSYEPVEDEVNQQFGSFGYVELPALKQFRVRCFLTCTEGERLTAIRVAAPDEVSARHVALNSLKRQGYPNAMIPPEHPSPLKIVEEIGESVKKDKYSVLCIDYSDGMTMISFEVDARDPEEAKKLALDAVRKSGHPKAEIAPELNNPLAPPVVMKLS